MMPCLPCYQASACCAVMLTPLLPISASFSMQPGLSNTVCSAAYWLDLRLTCQVPNLCRELPCEVRSEEAQAPKLAQPSPPWPQCTAKFTIATTQNEVPQATVMQEQQGLHESPAAEVS
jgi:hypothetical protein